MLDDIYAEGRALLVMEHGYEVSHPWDPHACLKYRSKAPRATLPFWGVNRHRAQPPYVNLLPKWATMQHD